MNILSVPSKTNLEDDYFELMRLKLWNGKEQALIFITLDYRKFSTSEILNDGSPTTTPFLFSHPNFLIKFVKISPQDEEDLPFFSEIHLKSFLVNKHLKHPVNKGVLLMDPFQDAISRKLLINFLKTLNDLDSTDVLKLKLALFNSKFGTDIKLLQVSGGDVDG